MFTNISWNDYVIAIGLLVLVWYLFLGFRFYYKEIKEFISGERRIKFPTLGYKKKKQSCLAANDKSNSRSTLSSSFFESFSTLEDAEELSSLLTNAIKESAERNLSKAEFRNYLKLILNDYPYVKSSTLRVLVNELMVSECEKHPQMILTYAEVDGLWDEAI
jgi:hypothetical protein